MPENYRHAQADGAAIDSTGPILTVEDTYDTHKVSLYLNATEATDFAVEARFGENDEWVEMYAYGATSSLSEVFDLPVYSLRVVVTTAATAGATADVKLGAD